MSAVLEPVPVPPPDDKRIRFQMPIHISPERSRYYGDAAYNEILPWLSDVLQRSPGKLVPEHLHGAGIDASIERSEWQHPVYNGHELLDFIDLYVRFKNACWTPTPSATTWPVRRVTDTLALLIVPEMISARDIVRRVRRLQAVEKCRYIVVSPDSRGRQALEIQGIGFLAAPPKTPLTQLGIDKDQMKEPPAQREAFT